MNQLITSNISVWADDINNILIKIKNSNPSVDITLRIFECTGTCKQCYKPYIETIFPETQTPDSIPRKPFQSYYNRIVSRKYVHA